MFLVFLVNFEKKLSLICFVPKKHRKTWDPNVSKLVPWLPLGQVFESHGALRQAGGAEGDGRLRPSDAPWAMMFFFFLKAMFYGQGSDKMFSKLYNVIVYLFIFFKMVETC